MQFFDLLKTPEQIQQLDPDMLVWIVGRIGQLRNETVDLDVLTAECDHILQDVREAPFSPEQLASEMLAARQLEPPDWWAVSRYAMSFVSA